MYLITVRTISVYLRITGVRIPQPSLRRTVGAGSDGVRLRENSLYYLSPRGLPQIISRAGGVPKEDKLLG